MTWTSEESGRLREYHTARMTVSEIAGKMQKKKSDIRRKLVEMGYLPIEKKPEPESSEFLKGEPVTIPRREYTKITTMTEKRVCELREQCFTTTQIAKKLHINSPQTVANILKRNGYPTERGKFHKETNETKEDKPMKAASINEEFDKAVNEMIAEAKEKEPASAATDTSPEQDITPVIPVINDTTEPQKSQAPALTGIKMMMEIEAMLGEVYGRDAQIIDINANGDHCDIGFTYHGREYSLLFAEREEVPDYGNDKH